MTGIIHWDLTTKNSFMQKKKPDFPLCCILWYTLTTYNNLFHYIFKICNCYDYIDFITNQGWKLTFEKYLGQLSTLPISLKLSEPGLNYGITYYSLGVLFKGQQRQPDYSSGVMFQGVPFSLLVLLESFWSKSSIVVPLPILIWK